MSQLEIMQHNRRKKVARLIARGYTLMEIWELLEKETGGNWSYKTIRRDIKAMKHEIEQKMTEMRKGQYASIVAMKEEIIRNLWIAFNRAEDKDKPDILTRLDKAVDSYAHRLQRLGVLPYHQGKLEIEEKKQFLALMGIIEARKSGVNTGTPNH